MKIKKEEEVRFFFWFEGWCYRIVLVFLNCKICF